MPEITNQEFAEYAVLRTVQLQAVATWIIQRLIVRLKKLESEILTELFQSDPTSSDADKEQSLKDLLDAIEQLIKAAYTEILSRIEDDFDELADAENERQNNQFTALFGTSPSQIDLSQIAGMTILGATISDWMERQAGDLNFKYKTALIQGVALNEPLDKLTRRVKGYFGTGDNSEIMSIAKPLDAATKNVETFVRTGVEGIAAQISDMISENMPDKIKSGWQSIAVIDSRTTELCMAYAYKIWDRELKPVGHELPYLPVPRHWCCRSSIVPITLDGDAVKPFTFMQWINGIPRDEQDAIFGKQNMSLWRSGKITDQALIRQQERSLDIEAYRNAPDPRLPKE